MSRDPTVEVERYDDHLVIRWDDGHQHGSCRFDRVPGTRPEWIGAADELLEGADRRSEGRILDAVAAWSRAEGLELGIWHDGAEVELLT